MTTENTNGFAGLTLLDIAGLDTSDIAVKKRGEALPKMFAQFKCVESKMEEIKDKDDQTKTVGFRFASEWEVEGIHKMLDREFEGKEAEYIGKKHVESARVIDVEGLSYYLGFLQSCGLPHKGALGDLVAGVVGTQINAIIRHTRNKDDKDIVYSNLDKIKPLTA